jgi:GNAT superfamily N-acetyltransferase
MLIRRFAPDDTASVLQLNVEALAETGAVPSTPGWDDDLRDVASNYLADGIGDFLVGIAEGVLVAMGGIVVARHSSAEVKRMRVLPEFQGRGYARKLLSALETRAACLGAATVFADTTLQQVKAQRFYLSMDYQLVERFETGGFTVLRYRKDLCSLAKERHPT